MKGMVGLLGGKFVPGRSLEPGMIGPNGKVSGRPEAALPPGKQSRSRDFTCLFLAVLLVMGGVQLAHSDELPATTKDALQRFYSDFNGDDWHNSDGWLDRSVASCDWYGVNCVSTPGNIRILSLELAGNNLNGSLSESDIFDHVHERVELQNNRIFGSLDSLPRRIKYIDLSDNQLTGNLPGGLGTQSIALKHLMLARNDISGVVPPGWSLLDLAWLDLSGNQLEGSLKPLIFAGTHQCCSYINLADNRFQGEIPDGIMNADLFSHNDNASGGGINLCWNDLQSGNSSVNEWLGRHHVGGDSFHLCLNRERIALGPEVSGSWFDPARNGEGVALQLLPDGRAVAFTFGFDNRGRQHWLLGVGTSRERTLHWEQLSARRGSFGQGAVDPGGPLVQFPAMGTGIDWRMDRVGNNEFVIERIYQDFSHCPDNSSSLCSGSPISDRLQYTRLSSLAGTTCGNQRAHQWISGAWYDPERDGEGFVVEVLEDGRGVVYWFTYRPDDSKHQAWMIGVGEFDGTTLHVEDVIQPSGGFWGDQFDPALIAFDHWGALTLEFFDEESGHVYWDSVREAYGSGDYPLKRLSGPRLAECQAS